MGEEVSFVELEKRISVEEMAEVEATCNKIIRANKPVSIEMLKSKDDLRAGCKG